MSITNAMIYKDDTNEFSAPHLDVETPLCLWIMQEGQVLQHVDMVFLRVKNLRKEFSKWELFM